MCVIFSTVTQKRNMLCFSAFSYSTVEISLLLFVDAQQNFRIFWVGSYSVTKKSNILFFSVFSYSTEEISLLLFVDAKQNFRIFWVALYSVTQKT